MLQTLTRLIALLLLCTLSLSGCDSVPTRTTPDAVVAAERDFAAGEYARAAEGFTEAAAWNRRLRDTLLLRAAEAWREEGELERAGAALQGISSKRFDHDALQRLTLLQAEVALARTDAPKALDLLEGIAPQIIDSHRARHLELLARANEADGNFFQSAVRRAELAALLPETERAANTRAIQGLLTQLDDDALAFGAASLQARHPLYPEAARALSIRGLPLPHPLPTDAVTTGTDTAGYLPYRRIALLLPLDSAIDAAAQAVRDGFIAGYFEETRERPEVRIYASGNAADTALAAWQSALRDGAQAVVGPLGREEVAAVFEADREGATPLLALNRGGSTPPPPRSLSFALAPEDEGTAAANRIARRAGSRVLVVQGSDDYGQRAVAALGQRLAQRGGQIVATIHIPEDSPNYAPAIAAALSQAGARAVAADGDTRIQQNRVAVEADAIFFAGRAEQARLLVPQLRVAGIYDLPIYATSQLTAGAGNARLDRELDGIEFTEAPWLFRNVEDTPTRDSLAALDSTHGSGARLFAFGLDAFRLIGHLEQFARDPKASVDGATGKLRADGFGNVLRTPAWARFQGGRILPVGEAGGLIGDELQFDQP